ncbi:MAG: ABC transporter substrate-binding protein [Candidatus Izemoplasmatales bacterium]
MKKITLLLLTLFASITLFACEQKTKLYVLNWGEYMDYDLISAFEDEYGVDVVYKEVGSNEEMATLLQAGSSVYDVVIPSDYMIDKLIQEDLIQPIDFTKLTNFENLEVIPTLYNLYSGTGIEDYVVPYAWGTIGILYNTNVDGLAEMLADEGWGAMFEHGDTYKVGMYDSPRDAVAAALLYNGYNVNSEVTSELDAAEQSLIDANFFAWGEDNLKSLVIQGVLDMALVYSGDYFSEYYIADEEGTTINFDYYVPDTTNVWMDAMVIPTIAEHVDLAHEFINFFLREDVALQNSDYIGYAPCYQVIYTQMVDDYGYDFDTFDPFPEGTTRQMYVYGSTERSDALVSIIARAKAA